VGNKGITYTRYADDLTFSAPTSQHLLKIITVIRKIIEDEGFSINPRKTRLAGTRKQKRITGLIIAEDRVGIGRTKFRLLRSKIYNLVKRDAEPQSLSEIDHIMGWLAFTKTVDKKRFSRLGTQITKLQKKYPDSGISLLNLNTN